MGAALARIGSAVEGGETDLAKFGFWRLVGRVKRDPALIEAHAETIGRIDREAFERWVRFWVPVWFGNLLLVIGIAVGIAAILVATEASSEIVAALALLVATGALSLAVHSPAHWVVGRLVGIRFTHYFLGGPPPPRPGVKTDYASYLRASPRARAWMHASGAIATKLAPFAVAAFYPLTEAPAWVLWLVLAYGAFQILTDVLFSVRSSDWKKVRREVRVARELRRGA